MTRGAHDTGGPQRQQNRSKRQAILEGAQRLMVAEGYGAITYRGVATAADVAPGLVQYYFPSRTTYSSPCCARPPTA